MITTSSCDTILGFEIIEKYCQTFKFSVVESLKRHVWHRLDHLVPIHSFEGHDSIFQNFDVVHEI
jgi:hypothetical protein